MAYVVITYRYGKLAKKSPQPHMNALYRLTIIITIYFYYYYQDLDLWSIHCNDKGDAAPVQSCAMMDVKGDFCFLFDLNALYIIGKKRRYGQGS